ncbi:MarR family winged helix-turn-helix transcriptional regulator [Pontiella sulfatireligans]|uniref:HTH marR-type domain-containing protein n=1 Tax=Pontiella sulfatireligans TaxID=2750658 RepID=A0A6C2UR53_9BACT|nr:MarR family transcriptional regulator [Pontiella sulfatireligans]VGO22589.1 hypothetical protein SCARR_04674 [Pontiella sulfatireligans]
MTTNPPNTQGIIGQIARIRELSNLFIELELRNVAIEGILPAHGSILNFLFQQDAPVPMKEIVERIGRVKSTVTGMIHTLEQYGYVEKLPSPEDGRVVLVKLTEKGCSLKPPFKQISKKLIARLYGNMAVEQKDSLVELLTQIEGNLQPM